MQPKSLLPPLWDVPPAFRQRIGAAVGRQRVMQADGHLLLVLHAPPSPDDDQRVGRFIWRKPDGTWTCNDLGTGANVVGKHLTQYADLIERFDRQEETATTADDYFAVLEGLAPLHRSARNMHAVLQEARQLVPDDRDLINYRDQAYEIERRAELTYNGAKAALDYAVAKQAERQAADARRMAVSAHRLNLLAAFFFPLATLSALFGVNIRHGLEGVQPPIVFVVFVGLALFVGVALMRFIARP
jgi:hypothetical protein